MLLLLNISLKNDFVVQTREMYVFMILEDVNISGKIANY